MGLVYKRLHGGRNKFATRNPTSIFNLPLYETVCSLHLVTYLLSIHIYISIDTLYIYICVLYMYCIYHIYILCVLQLYVYIHTHTLSLQLYICTYTHTCMYTSTLSLYTYIYIHRCTCIYAYIHGLLSLILMAAHIADGLGPCAGWCVCEALRFWAHLSAKGSTFANKEHVAPSRMTISYYQPNGPPSQTRSTWL